jgi:hypothetical protein
VTRRQGIGADLIHVVAASSAVPNGLLDSLDEIDVGARLPAGLADAGDGGQDANR